MSQQEPSQEQVARAVYGYAAQLMREGQSNYKVQKALVEKGLTEDVAQKIVQNLDQERQRQYNQASRDAALKNMAIGGVVCIIGLVISIGTYQAAVNSPGGGRYFVAWGAVIFGGIQFFKGLAEFMS